MGCLLDHSDRDGARILSTDVTLRVDSSFAPPVRNDEMKSYFTAPWFRILALPVFFLLAGGEVQAARAGSLGYRNDTDIPIIVQCFSIVNNRVVQGRPHTLQPGETAWDVRVIAGNKRILVADAKQPTRLLARENLIFMGQDQFFSIQDDSADALVGKQGRKPAITAVKLVPEDVPNGGPANAAAPKTPPTTSKPKRN